jgi:hypothetical protein
MNNAISNVNAGACKKLGKDINPKINRIIQRYYNDLDERYLCAFEFNDEQLNRYVRLSSGFGGRVMDSDMKTQINLIKQSYLDIPKYSQHIQCRILTTNPNSINPYASYILDSDNNVYSRMKAEIVDTLKLGGKITRKKPRKYKLKSKKPRKYKLKKKTVPFI